MMNTPKWIGIVSNGLGGWRLWSKDEPGMGGRDHPDAEYILASEHDRIVAAKDAEIARLWEAIDGAAFQITVLANRLETHEDDMALSAQAFSSRLRDTAIRAMKGSGTDR